MQTGVGFLSLFLRGLLRVECLLKTDQWYLFLSPRSKIWFIVCRTLGLYPIPYQVWGTVGGYQQDTSLWTCLYPRICQGPTMKTPKLWRNFRKNEIVPRRAPRFIFILYFLWFWKPNQLLSTHETVSDRWPPTYDKSGPAVGKNEISLIVSMSRIVDM